MGSNGRLGIMAAMPEELDAILSLFSSREPVIHHGNRAFHRGRIGTREVVAVFSRCGKVAAAATATELIIRFEVESLVFTGLAGGVGDDVRVGDIVVPTTLVQHDLDARPLFPRFEVPLMRTSVFQTDPALRSALSVAASRFLAGTESRVHEGLLATGDQFVAGDAHRRLIRDALPDAIAVDMEAAAVGQVAADYGIPLAVVRLVSDAADTDAASAFAEALSAHAGAAARAIFSQLML